MALASPNTISKAAERASTGAVGRDESTALGARKAQPLPSRWLHTSHPTYDVLSLVYLRNPLLSPTRVSMPKLGELDSDLISSLRKYQFKLLTSHVQNGDRNTIPRNTSFIYAGENWIRFTFARLLEQRGEYEASGALLDVIDALLEHLEAGSETIPSIPGHLAFIDNMRVAHARAPFLSSPRFDGTDQWQRRLGLASKSRQNFIESLMEAPVYRLVSHGKLLSHLLAMPSAERLGNL